ncbi:proton channel OtopLc-like [Frieseomelitta varia]|uniref:proton channel OtopLc-like n=1 Tax=Frieseomelitta varia TaxID=561572 RepID=UPI001CB6972E|nr:proton channel OtopLc-like [Frieseomelitta varia]
MVAELTDIPVANVERKTPTADPEQFRSSAKPKNRPKWIEAATREPIYSVLDSNNGSTNNLSSNAKNNVVVISAVKNEKPRRTSSEQRELPYVWLPTDSDKPTTFQDSTIREEDEDPLYSVVRKPKKVRLSESSYYLEGKKLQPIKERSTKERQTQLEVCSRQEELRRWLQVASEQLPEPRRLFSLGEMYTSHHLGEFDQLQADWKRKVAMPKGIVGLVGPYRVYQNPNERREYMLQEEELVEEEVVDSVSEIAARENNNGAAEHHQRAKWRIREDDEETLVPDIRNIASLEGFATEADNNSPEWKKIDDLYSKNDEALKSKVQELEEGNIEGIVSGKEERAVDVPEEASTASTSSMTDKNASNEQHDKDSLNETGSTTGGTVEGVPAGAPNRGERNTETETAATEATRSAPSRSLVSRILSRTRSTNDLLDHSEPFSQLWVILSNVYGQLIVVLMIALCLAEVMDTPVPLLSLQGIFLMYLYVGSIAVIISIYIWVLVDSCGSFGTGAIGVDDAELGGASLTRFGSLKRAHISRSRTAPTSFYIRVGALLFGLATLVFNGLEMAMHSMMQGTECLSDVVFVHPVLHGLFTFLQMHFLFVNSQVLVERFGLAARFGFIHLTATNIAVWVRLVIWDSAQEWTYFVHLAQRGLPNSASPLNLRGFPESLIRRSRDLLSHPSVEKQVFQPYQPISNEQISQVIALQECLNTNTLGQLWTSSMPFLYPFIVQFSLIAAAVTFVMGQNVGRNRLLHKQKFHGSKDLTSHTKVGCDGSSKGLFLGILCMVAGIVVILIFLVVREDEHFPSSTLSWLTCGTLTSILTLSALMTASGLVQVRQMSVVSRAPAILDTLLSNVALFGVQLYSIFTIVVSACSLALLEDEDDETRGRHIMLLTASILQLIQCFAQSTLIAETSKRSCITRFQIIAKPARQVITFLLFSNSVLWAFDTVITQNWISQELQLRFFGVLAWGIISRIGLPLLIFYRFHSCVLLLEAWNKCYRMPRGEHPLN